MAKHINQFLNNIISNEHIWKITLLKNWDNIIGEFKGNVIIEKIQDDLLILGVCHPVFAQELFLISDDIKKRVNDFLKEEKIRKIQFRYINFDKLLKNKKSGKKEEVEILEANNNLEIFTLTKHEQEQLNKISDKNLKESLRNFYLRCKK